MTQRVMELLLALFLQVDYSERLELVQRVKQEHPYPKGWTDHRDGIAIQALWQDQTGRDAAKWWSNVNWTLTVWPVLVLQKHRGEFQDVQIQGGPAIPDAFAKALLAYYDELDAVRQLTIPAYLQPWHQWRLQKLLWNWHHLAVTIGMQQNQAWLPSLGPGEARFAASWGTMVGILKAINFPTSANAVGLFNEQALPNSWVSLADYDLGQWSPLSLSQRLTLKALWSIHQFETKWGHPIEKILTWLVDSPAKAAKAVSVLKKALSEGWTGAGLWWKLWGI